MIKKNIGYRIAELLVIFDSNKFFRIIPPYNHDYINS